MSADSLFHLVDVESSNVVGSYRNIDGVIDNMCDAVQEYGIGAAEGYVVILIEGEEQSAFLQPDDLVNLVKQRMYSH
jgi:hypothetical protein